MGIADRITGAGRATAAASAHSEWLERLGRAGLAEESEGHFRRIVVEKPFGRDLQSSRELDAQLHEYFREHQIYRIDHYLAKETVQNILALRFTNTIFEPIWNRRYVDHVQITVAEDLGVEHRGTFYEQSGALRDIVQNHLLQVLALTAMEPPASFDANAIRDEKVKALARKVSVVIDPEFADVFEDSPSRVTVTLANGRTVERMRYYASGTPQVPFTKEQVEEKFFSCAERSIDKAAATKLFAILNRFEQERSFAELWGLVKRA